MLRRTRRKTLILWTLALAFTSLSMAAAEASRIATSARLILSIIVPRFPKRLRTLQHERCSLIGSLGLRSNAHDGIVGFGLFKLKIPVLSSDVTGRVEPG